MIFCAHFNLSFHMRKRENFAINYFHSIFDIRIFYFKHSLEHFNLSNKTLFCVFSCRLEFFSCYIALCWWYEDMKCQITSKERKKQIEEILKIVLHENWIKCIVLYHIYLYVPQTCTFQTFYYLSFSSFWCLWLYEISSI